MSYSAPSQPWWIVARREMMAKLTDKGYWFSTIFMLVMIVVAFAVSLLIGNGDTTTRVGVTDDDGSQVVAVAAQTNPDLGLEAVTVPEDELESQITDGDLDLGLVRTETGWSVLVSDFSNAAMTLQQAAEAYTIQENAESLGVDLNELNAGTQVAIITVGEADDGAAAVAIITGIVFSILFFISALTYGLQIAQSVVEEKESRIVEILVAAIPIRQLLWGKVVGNSIMALGQLVLLLGVGVIGLSQTEYATFLPMIAPSMGWFIVFFLFGFAALACLWAATGAMATRVQDLSNATTPLMMLLMFAYFGGLAASGTAAQILSYVPVVSSILMPQQLLAGEATWVDAIIALALTSAFMAVAVWIGERIYRRGVMNTSSVLKWSQALKSES